MPRLYCARGKSGLSRIPRALINPAAPGDRLLLYSDGVLEARDRAGQFFDGDRVARWLSAIERTSAEQFAAAALSQLTQWSGGGFDDDVTFVIIKFLQDVAPLGATPARIDSQPHSAAGAAPAR